MTQLFIRTGNGRPWQEAALPSDFRFKLTVDNTYFTRSGEYSGEIELPLSGCPDNLRIFGHINRLDVNRRSVVFDARLVVDNRSVVVGSVTVLECNEQMVKVQLLGGNAAVNFNNRYNSTYIDQLNLGTVIDGLEIYVTYDSDGGQQTLDVVDAESLAQYLAIRALFYNAGTRDDSQFGTPANGFVIHPAVDESGCEVNSQVVISWQLNPPYTDEEDISHGSLSDRWSSDRLVTYPGLVAEGTWTDSPPSCNPRKISGFRKAMLHDEPVALQYRLCPQPYVDTVLRRVITALGYTITADAVSTGPFSRCYIPSTTETIKINEMLPHWLVTDFFSEIEEFFGVIICFDDAKRTCRILFKKDFFADRDPAHLAMVDDRFETSFDDDSVADISKSNVSFGVDADIHRLADDIVNRANVEDYNDESETIMRYSLLVSDSTIFGHDPKSVIASRAGRHYIVSGGDLVECDELRDYRPSEAGNSTIDLKIRPAKMDVTKTYLLDVGRSACLAYHTWSDSDGYMSPKLYPAPICPVYGAFSNDFSVEDAIVNGVPSNEKPDYLPVAIDNDYFEHMFYVRKLSIGVDESWAWRARWGSTFGRDDVSDMSLDDSTVVLRLNPVEGLTTLYDQAVNIGLRIVGQALTRVRIYDNTIPSLDRFFIFNGKRFCCQKIEYTVTNEGFEREKTGYFYTVDES